MGQLVPPARPSVKPKYVKPSRKALTAAEIRIAKDLKRKAALNAQLEKLAQAVNYDKDAPRCINCKYHRKAGLPALPGVTVPHKPKCKQHGFQVHDNGCCDSWVGKNGDTLA